MAGKPPGSGRVSTGEPPGHQHGEASTRGSQQGGRTMGAIRVHEFISLDSVIDTPSWTFPFGFDPRMGEAIGRITTSSDGILLGRSVFQFLVPTWTRGAAGVVPCVTFFNGARKYVVAA